MRYKQTTLKDRSVVYIHRKVWEEHHGPIPKGMVIHHKNSDKLDNRIENLEMITQTQNMQRSDRMGKGWVVKGGKRARPYAAIRKVNGKRLPKLGMYGTKCGAYMASRMALVTR